MTPQDYEREWELLAGLLPEGWQEAARHTGAIRRSRGLSDPAKLLRLLLMHVATGLSLRSTAARARVQGLAQMSDAGILDRLRRAEKWLAWMCQKLFSRSRCARAALRVATGRRQLRAVDATTVEEPGATGTDWRVHLAVALPECRIDYFKVTDATQGEKLGRVPIHADDIVLGDRAYCHRAAVARVVERGADVVVRLSTSSFPLRTRAGKRFQFLPHLRTLHGFRPKAWAVTFEDKGKVYPARLCALRKSAEAAALARKKVRRKARNSPQGLKSETLECAEYVFVLTTLSKDEFSVRDVLELYRARWQVELVFKRLKSLLRLSALHKQTDSSARAWLQAKLLTALLIEELMEAAGLFSPWGHDLAAPFPAQALGEGA
jgi:Transposase DDE domain